MKFTTRYPDRVRAFKERTASKIIAGVLATITLFVFWVLQDYGPESSLRRFHDAIASNNATQLATVSMQNVESDSVRLLASRVYTLMRAGAQVQRLKVSRQGRVVIEEVAYILPDGRTVLIYWVIEKPRDKHDWLVNSDATLEIMRNPSQVR